VESFKFSGSKRWQIEEFKKKLQKV
jgi:hypothetical protein